MRGNSHAQFLEGWTGAIPSGYSLISHGSSPTRAEIYESLYLICQATQQITYHLERLRATSILEPVFAEINKTATLQLRAQIATSAVHNLAAPEIEEAHRHESKRIRMERRLAQDKPAQDRPKRILQQE